MDFTIKIPLGDLSYLADSLLDVKEIEGVSEKQYKDIINDVIYEYFRDFNKYLEKSLLRLLDDPLFIRIDAVEVYEPEFDTLKDASIEVYISVQLDKEPIKDKISEIIKKEFEKGFKI